MVTALKRMGFDRVFDTDFAADLTIMEEGTELLTRLKGALVDGEEVALPLMTSCSPGWIKFAEHFFPSMLPNLSTCKSPQQMFGAVAKTYYAEKLNLRPEQIFVVSVMPCTAKKYECGRPEMNDSGTRDVDVVLTTRELGKMIRGAGLDFQGLPDEEMDAPLGLSTGAADIFANTGGVMEAALRTAYEIVTGRELPMDNLHVEPVAGLDGLDGVQSALFADFDNDGRADALWHDVTSNDYLIWLLDENGQPVTRWDGRTTKTHPVTGRHWLNVNSTYTRFIEGLEPLERRPHHLAELDDVAALAHRDRERQRGLAVDVELGLRRIDVTAVDVGNILQRNQLGAAAWTNASL